MEPWKRVTVMVTVIVFSMQIRPMDSYFTAYVTSPRVGVTLDEVSKLVPICINVAVIGSLLLSVISDYVKYKPVMIFCAFMGMLAFVFLINCSTLFILKCYYTEAFAQNCFTKEIIYCFFKIQNTHLPDNLTKSAFPGNQVCYSLMTCADSIYFSYLFAMIKDKEQYQIATSYATAGMMSGKFVSGVLGQLVIYLNDNNYYVLLYYNLTCVTFAFLCILFLPSVKHRKNSHVIDDVAEKTAEVFSKEVIHDPNILKYSTENAKQKNIDSVPAKKNQIKLIYEEIVNAYKDPQILRWTLWHAIGIAAYTQIILYINILYTYIADETNDKNILLNGLANSIATVSAAICTYKVGKIDVEWSRYGDMFLAISSLIIGLTMYLCYCSTNDIVVYILYCCYYAIIQSVFVISISQIGKQVKNDRYALVLGFCIFTGLVLSMLLSSIMTYFMISIPGHFLVYSGTFLATGIVYGFVACFTTTRKFTQLP